MDRLHLNDPLTTIKGVGPALETKYATVGIKTVKDILYYFPRRYEDYSVITPISRLKPGKITIQATIIHVNGTYIRGGLHITEAIAKDESGSVKIVWFNQPYRTNTIKKDMMYYISGQFSLRRGRLAITNPSMELSDTFTVNTARIVPIYRETKDISSNLIRKTLRTIFSSKLDAPESLPEEILSRQALLTRTDALFNKHFPVSIDKVHQADERLGFEELFELIATSMYSRSMLDNESALHIPFSETLAKRFVKHLPFELTDSQRKSIWHILQDMQKERPMNRLLEGDVGSGKTVVATMAAAMVIHSGYQVALMAPTEILAQQHAETIHAILKPLGLDKYVTLLIGSTGIKAKSVAYKNIESGQVRMLIGTHALLQEKVSFKKLGLVIVDEQHRFGVEQRKRLLKIADYMPHMLSMTATPIPRSLALTVFGEVDVSVLNEKPSSRQTVITRLVNPTDRLKVYEDIKSQLNSGRQMFVVCPVIREGTGIRAKSASEMYNELKHGEFSRYKIGLLHGKMSSDEKQRVMKDFVEHKKDILVSTTVIEVGVDVPNANIMVIETPERFGLAQLHQLRGRIGRGKEQGICYIMLSDSSEVSKRLKAIAEHNDGFKLAEMDLDLRGAGALYGTLQHGLLDLRVANFNDVKLIERAREEAKRFLKDTQNLIQYPYIKERILELQHVVHLN